MSEVTLDTCAQEPIHIPGSIQPHGALLVCRGPDLVIEQASANVVDHLGVAIADTLGKPIGSVLAAAFADRLVDAARAASTRAVDPVAVVARNGRGFEATLHRPAGLADAVIVELEPARETRLPADGTGLPFDPRLRTTILRLQRSNTVADLCTTAADEVKAITGFDRVMVYRFDEQWNGEVVAESRRADLEPFLGLHYPASDIPEQARRLYTINWLRLIVDIDYRPSPIVPVLNPGSGQPLDLSFAHLRSVSPIHIEYLRNMGVTASMSISLVQDGTLVGLIACHHYSGPWRLSFQIRETVEYLGQALSWQIGALEKADQAAFAAGIKATETRLVGKLALSNELLDALAVPELLELVDATGAAIVLREGSRTVGTTPGTEAIARIVAWLERDGRDVVATDRLQAELPEALAWDRESAGLVAVAVSREIGEYVLWFRPSCERVVDWAGDPRKNTVTEGVGSPPRLSPRGSFALWRETVRGSSRPWHPLQVEAASSLRRVLLGGVRRRSAELREINECLAASDREKDAFIAAVSHELRTPLSAISGWTHLLRTRTLPEAQTTQALEVIARNVHSQTRLIEDLIDVSRMTAGKLTISVAQVDLVGLIDSVLEEFSVSIEAKGMKVRKVLETSAVVLGDRERLRQVISNIINNALKFTPKHEAIGVTLQRRGSDVELAITDKGKGIDPEFLPHIFKAFRQAQPGITRRTEGLGLGLAIAHKLVELHGGRLVAESEGEGKGATFRVFLPVAPTTRREQGKPATSHSHHCPPPLDTLRVLIVEDDPDSQEFLRVILHSCGAVVSAASTAAEALELLATRSPELMISDIGLPDMDGFELLKTIRSGNVLPRIPAVALSAYTRAIDRTRALQAGFQAHVAKPVDPDELLTVAASVAGRFG